MNLRRTQEQSAELRRRILEELTKRPQGMRELARDLGLGHRTAEKHFDALKLRGLIGFYGRRTAPKWAPKAVADRENAAAARRMATRTAEQDERREKARARRKAEEAALDMEIEREKHAGGAEWTRTIRRVPAESVRAEIIGPRWVWDLAA